VRDTLICNSAVTSSEPLEISSPEAAPSEPRIPNNGSALKKPGGRIMDEELLFRDRIAVLRENDGMMLRRVLETLRKMDDHEAKDLYGMLVQHPELHDLVPN